MSIGDRHLRKERGRSRIGQREKLNYGTGLTKPQLLPWGALERVLPIKVVLCWAEMVVPLYLCLTQSLEEDMTLARSGQFFL